MRLVKKKINGCLYYNLSFILFEHYISTVGYLNIVGVGEVRQGAGQGDEQGSSDEGSFRL